MSLARRFEKAFRFFLPSPLALALLLTLFSFALAFGWGQIPADHFWEESLQHWFDGIWNPPLLVFMVQMMLILVLGHALALAPPVHDLIQWLLKGLRSPALATAAVAFFTILVAFFNWGLGLVFGAIMARKTAEKFAAQSQRFHYGLLGAAGYSGMMVWHGGLSGSAPLKAGEAHHLRDMLSEPYLLAQLPERLPLSETIFSGMNISASLFLLFSVPALLYFLALRQKGNLHAIEQPISQRDEQESYRGAEKIDHSPWVGRSVGIIVLGSALALALLSPDGSFISPNWLNFSLLGLGFLLHQRLHTYGSAVEEASRGAAGILLQFPLYFGIMALLNESGLIAQLSHFFSTNTNLQSFPLLTFLSGGLINIFVPSGGGQWAIQGPVLLETALQLNLPLGKAVMALAYGDQVTNMLQPFWALPLLAITGLKAREILPYTLLLMLLGSFIFIAHLLYF